MLHFHIFLEAYDLNVLKMSEIEETYHYSAEDVKFLLRERCHGSYEIIDPIDLVDNFYEFSPIQKAFTVINNPSRPNTVVIPINIGKSLERAKTCTSHWVGLVIKQNENLRAFYMDSNGVPMDRSFPDIENSSPIKTSSVSKKICILRQNLINLGVTDDNIIETNLVTGKNDSKVPITRLMYNYDCGPYTVFNLDSLAKTGHLAKITPGDISEQRKFLLEKKREAFRNDQALYCKSCQSGKEVDYNEQLDADFYNTYMKKTYVKQTNFVISTIVHVPEHDEQTSSDEEIDNTFPENFFNFDSQFKIPFTTECPRGVRKKKIKIKELENTSESNETRSNIVDKFLKLLSVTGLSKRNTSISASVALNRMLSVSTSKNKLLESELGRKIDTEIRFERFAFFWECGWYNVLNNECDVSYKTVRKYYKQLKRKSPVMAELLRKEEQNIKSTPFQILREYAKNHKKTMILIREANSRINNVYLSLIDIDTVSFNRIYDAYIRIVEKEIKAPTVMSTGYIFPEVSTYGSAFSKASEIDRQIRYLTSKHFPLGVYYPEPNMCILIIPGCNTLHESFINNKKENLESVCLLLDIYKKRKGATYIFSSNSPLITTVPNRAYNHSTVGFSPEFREGAAPTQTDLQTFKQVSQSHFRERIWYNSLLRDPTIVIKKGEVPNCKKIISKIFQSEQNVEKFKDKFPDISHQMILNDIYESKEGYFYELKKYTSENIAEEILYEIFQNNTKHQEKFKIKYPLESRKILKDVEQSKSDYLNKLQQFTSEDIAEKILDIISEDKTTYDKKVKKYMKKNIPPNVFEEIYHSWILHVNNLKNYVPSSEAWRILEEICQNKNSYINKFKQGTSKDFAEEILADIYKNKFEYINKLKGYTSASDAEIILREIYQSGKLSRLYLKELTDCTSEDIAKKLCLTIESVNDYKRKFKLYTIRQKSEQRFLDALKREGIRRIEVSSDNVDNLSEVPVLEFIEDRKITLKELLKLDEWILGYLCYDTKLLDILKNDITNWPLLFEMLYSEEFSTDLYDAVNINGSELAEIFEKFKEDPLHIKFMGGDPADVVYLNSDCPDIVVFGRDNYDISEEGLCFIRSELKGTALHVFESAWFEYGIKPLDEICEENEFKSLDEISEEAEFKSFVCTSEEDESKSSNETSDDDEDL